MQTLTITLIQTALFWEDKKKNLAMLQNKILAIQQPTEVVLLPEMFSTGFSMQPHLFAEKMEGETVEWMKQIASTKKIILVGSIIIEEDNKFYNRLIWMLPNGQYGIYDKRHLFAFAGEHEHYTAGNKRLIAQVKGFKINLQICYDLRFAVWARQATTNTAEPEYDVLIYVANWPQRRSLAWQTLLKARAIENQCVVVGVNRVGNDGNNIYHSGNSMVINPFGDVLYEKVDDEDLYTITINKEEIDEVRTKLPFLKDADSFYIT